MFSPSPYAWKMVKDGPNNTADNMIVGVYISREIREKNISLHYRQFN